MTPPPARVPHPLARWRTPAYAGLLVALTLIAYLPALRAGYIWDDNWHVTENATLRSLDGLRQIWFEPSRPGRITIPQYYPLTHTTFWIEHHLWGDRPFGYHLNNVLLHAGSALLLWRLLLRLNVPAAWFAAAIWAIHPVQVESVAWVSERKNTLSAFFYLASFSTYVRFALPSGPIGASKGLTPSVPDWRFYFLSLVLFFCALWSKTVSSTLPAAVLLVLWWKHGRLTVRDVTRLIPFFLAGAAMGSVTSWMERNVIGAVGTEWAFTPVDRLLIAGRAACFYAAKLLFPFALSFNYERWTIDPRLWWQWLFPVVVLAGVGVLFALRLRIGRGPLTGALFFLGTLAPALGFFDIYPMRYSFVADHFQYLASVGLIVLATAVVHRLKAPAKRRRRDVPAIPAVPAIFLLTLATLTYARAKAFTSSETLWLDTIAKNPNSWMANQNYGGLLVEQGRLDEAESRLRRVIELNPDHVEARLRLAAIATSRNQLDDAERWFREALAIQPPYPPGTPFYQETAVPHVRFAIWLADQGRTDEAIAEYHRALGIAPGYPLAKANLANLHNRIGVSLFQSGKVGDAIAHFREAVAVHPESPEAHNSLGVALAAAGKREAAERAYRTALSLRPDFEPARRNLARLLSPGAP
jgi:Flp pilus assembly protein TadD